MLALFPLVIAGSARSKIDFDPLVLLELLIAGSIAVVCGVFFALALFLAPRRGLVSQARRRRAQRLDLSLRMLVVHLLHHQGTAAETEECRSEGIHQHLRWTEARTRQVLRQAEERRLVERSGELLHATVDGTRLANAALIEA